MRQTRQLFCDVTTIFIATPLAMLLRNDFRVEPAQLGAIAPYLGFTIVAAALILPVLGVTRTIWRFTSLRDLLTLAVAVVAVVIAALGMSFLYNRLDGVPRALPLLQIMTILLIMVGVRVAQRLRFAKRARPLQFMPPTIPSAQDQVLIVGVSQQTDLFLKALNEAETASLKVVGILGRWPRQAGASFDRIPVLGTPDELAEILRTLEVHGIGVTRIVVAMPFRNLTDEARQALLDVERSSTIRIDVLGEVLGFETRGTDKTDAVPEPEDTPFAMPVDEGRGLAGRRYWRLKRSIDIIAAGTLLVLLFPLTLMVAVLTALNVGLPVVFWQQRPGLGGHPFRVYKFRTMSGAHDRHGRRVPDAKRLSGLGRFMRASRVDELPQLWNILKGDMSFVGPRPLLPVDQSKTHAARLLIRPGLTGWAQVMGGRVVSSDDKAALDIWYVKHASLCLDLEILARTIGMILFGERVRRDAIEAAWRDLENAYRTTREVPPGRLAA